MTHDERALSIAAALHDLAYGLEDDPEMYSPDDLDTIQNLLSKYAQDVVLSDSSQNSLTIGQQASLTKVVEAVLGQTSDEILANLEQVAERAQALVDTLGTAVPSYDDDDDIIMPPSPTITMAHKAAPEEGSRSSEFSELCRMLEEQGSRALVDFLYTQSREYVVASCGLHPRKAKTLRKHTELCDYAVTVLQRTLRKGSAFLRVDAQD